MNGRARYNARDRANRSHIPWQQGAKELLFMNRRPWVSRRELLGAGLLAAGASPLFIPDRSAGAEGLSRSTLVTAPYVVVETARGKVRGSVSGAALRGPVIPR